jgi:hypothetical protein
MASYPTSVKVFGTKAAGGTVEASHINDLQDEVNSIEGGLLNGTAPLNSSGSTCASLNVSSNVTIGTGSASDRQINFDGNAQDFHIGIDDSADDLILGLGTSMGTTPIISLDENRDVLIHQSIRINSDSEVISFGAGTDASIAYDGTNLVITPDLVGSGSVVIAGTSPRVTIGDAAAEDTSLVFDGNAQDFYLGLDDSADDLVLGLGATVGTTPILSLDEDRDVLIHQSIRVVTDSEVISFGAGTDASIAYDGTNLVITPDLVGSGSVVIAGTTPQLTIGDAGAEDTSLVFDGNAHDFYIGLDDTSDALVIGLGSTVGTNSAITIVGDGSEDVTLAGDLTVSGTGPHAIGGASVDYVQLVFPGSFTSGGASTTASMIKVSGALVGHSGDSDGLAYFRLSPTSNTINGNATTVATLYVDEPGLVETSGNATVAATVYISGAATEATSNYALLVDAGASRLDGTLSVSSGSAGSPGFMMDEDTDTGFFRPGANRMAVATAGVSRMEWAAGGLVGINETANGNMTVGLTINQGTADNQAFCLKSSDIATGLTTGTITQDMETDDWFSVSKRDGATGGVLFTVLREDGGAGTVWEVQAYGSTASTADNTGEEGPLHLFAAEHDGSNGLVNAPTDANLLTVQSWSGGAKTTRLLLKADDGELHLGNTTLVALDDEEDIQYVRAMQFETSHGTGMAKTPWDTTDYGIPPFSHQMLMDIGVLGEKDENGECLFRVQPRFAMNEGAIWQLYCHNRTLAERVETLERRLLDA